MKLDHHVFIVIAERRPGRKTAGLIRLVIYQPVTVPSGVLDSGIIVATPVNDGSFIAYQTLSCRSRNSSG